MSSEHYHRFDHVREGVPQERPLAVTLNLTPVDSLHQLLCHLVEGLVVLERRFFLHLLKVLLQTPTLQEELSVSVIFFFFYGRDNVFNPIEYNDTYILSIHRSVVKMCPHAIQMFAYDVSEYGQGKRPQGPLWA